jgi:hypothetical protein
MYACWTTVTVPLSAAFSPISVLIVKTCSLTTTLGTALMILGRLFALLESEEIKSRVVWFTLKYVDQPDECCPGQRFKITYQTTGESPCVDL